MPDVERINLHFTDAADRMCAWETDDLQIMRIRMPVGEVLPHHNSNANSVLLPMLGKIKLVTPAGEEVFGVGEAVFVPFDTPMDVSNAGDEPALLLVLKAPHPKAFQ